MTELKWRTADADDVVRSPRSMVVDRAESLHTINGVLVATLADEAEGGGAR